MQNSKKLTWTDYFFMFALITFGLGSWQFTQEIFIDNSHLVLACLSWFATGVMFMINIFIIAEYINAKRKKQL